MHGLPLKLVPPPATPRRGRFRPSRGRSTRQWTRPAAPPLPRVGRPARAPRDGPGLCSNRAPHHLCMDVAPRCVAFRDDRPLLGLGIEPLAQQRLRELARSARKLVVTHVRDRAPCRGRAAGAPPSDGLRRVARCRRATRRTRSALPPGAPDHPGLPEPRRRAHGLRRSFRSVRPTRRGTTQIRMPRRGRSHRCPGDCGSGRRLIDRRGAPVERGSDLSKTRGGRPPGCPVVLDSLIAASVHARWSPR